MEKKRQRRLLLPAVAMLLFTVVLTGGRRLQAMHVMEGYLAPVWCIAWEVLCLPFLGIGLFQISKKVNQNSRMMLMLALSGAYIFVLSALKIPSVTGSCSHPTGTGFAAVLFGPFVTSVLGIIVLLFQAILLAHGGLITLGANTDRKSTRLNSSHRCISYAVFCLKKKNVRQKLRAEGVM